MYTTVKVMSFTGLLTCVVVAGCSMHEPTRVDENFGNSVRHMVQMQTYNPEAARRPSTEPPTELDGEKAGAVLDSYRTAVGKPSEIQKPITINVGN
jgi:type IV pilus biogenesis protein CpaD/CtpE